MTDEDTSIEQEILTKLNPIQAFCLKAKKFLDFTKDEKSESELPNTYLDAAHIVALAEKLPESFAGGETVCIKIKELREVLLAYQRNGHEVVLIKVKKDIPIVVSDIKNKIYMAIALITFPQGPF